MGQTRIAVIVGSLRRNSFNETGSLGGGQRKFLRVWMDRYVVRVKNHTV